MENEAGKQDKSDNPEDLAEPLKEVCVGIDRIGAKEDGEIAEEVADHEEHQNDSGERDDPFAADGTAEQGTAATGGFRGGGRLAHWR